MRKLMFLWIIGLLPIFATAQTASGTYIRTGPVTNVTFTSPQADATLIVGQPYKIQWSLPVENYSYPITLVKISGNNGYITSYGINLENKTSNSAVWTPAADLQQGNDYKLIFDEKYGDGWVQGESGTFTIINSGSVLGTPLIGFVQAPAEEKNILHTGERAMLYGVNGTTQIDGLDSSYKVKIQGNSLSKTMDLSMNLGRKDFIVPIIAGGAYDLFLDNGSKTSNKISVTVVGKDSIIIPNITTGKNSVGLDYQNGMVVNVSDADDAQKQQLILQLQTLLQSLIQQLIQLLQQQAAAAVMSQSH